MNRYFSILTAILLSALSFSLVSCSDDDNDSEGGKGNIIINGSKVSVSDADYSFSRWTVDWSDDAYFWYCTFKAEIKMDDYFYTLEMVQFAKTQKYDNGSWMTGYDDVKKLGWLNLGKELNPDVYFEYGFYVSGQTVEDKEGSIVAKSKSGDTIVLEFKNFKFEKNDVIYTLNGDIAFKQEDQIWD